MIRPVLYTLASVSLGVASLWSATDGFQAITEEGSRRIQIAETRPSVPAFSLETMSGRFEHLPENGNKPVLLEFIYTTCPDFCQISGGDFAELRDHLVSEEVDVRMYSVTFDPEVDQLEQLQIYGENHNADESVWTVARPEQDVLPSLLDFFRVTVIPDNWGGYQHNIAVLLINSEGQFAGVFDTRAFDEIAQAVKSAS
jgi:protein SCO1/2